MSSLFNTTQNEVQFHASTNFDVWLEIRAELEVCCRARIADRILAVQLKLSRCAEEDKHCAHLMLLGEIVSNLRRLQRWKC